MAEFGESRVQLGRIKMPDNEDLIPDTPTDAIGRYALLLLQWEDLTRRQARYDEEVRALQAKGDALQADWDSLAAERQHCLSALETEATPAGEVIERAWEIFKAHLWMLCQIDQRSASLRGAIPYAISTMAEPLTRNPRIL